MPAGAREGVLKGMYRFRPTALKSPKVKTKIHLLGSGPIMRYALRAQEMLAERYGVAADVWSVTSYKELRRHALNAERWNLLHPGSEPRRSYLETLLANEEGVYVPASDNMKAGPALIASWLQGA